MRTIVFQDSKGDKTIYRKFLGRCSFSGRFVSMIEDKLGRTGCLSTGCGCDHVEKIKEREDKNKDGKD